MLDRIKLTITIKNIIRRFIDLDYFIFDMEQILMKSAKVNVNVMFPWLNISNL